MKIFHLSLLCLSLAVLATTAHAKKGADGAKGDKVIDGKIVSVSADGTSVVIMTTGKKASEVTVTTDPQLTKVIINGKEAKLSDLAQDQLVEISPAIGVATSIKTIGGKHDAKPK